MPVTREQLEGLLVAPQEDLGLELKNWLDLQNANEDKATFAKAALALANHGGGFIVLGMDEAGGGAVEAAGRPATLDGYGQDLVNGVVHSYADPAFHCAVHLVADPAGALFPVVVVPGGHRTPIRARRTGPNNATVQLNAIYIRRPGPRSETPQNAQDWDALLARCLNNRRDEMFDQIRSLIVGAAPQPAEPPAPARLDAWIEAGRARWATLIEPLPAGVGPRMPHGRYWLAYEILGDRRQIAAADLPDALRASVVRHTGWPPFWYPARDGIAPYIMDDVVECWIGGDPNEPPEQRDPNLSDFWRIDPRGLALLLRGYQEDGLDAQQPGRPAIPPGTAFDVTLPVWRVGETLLQARRLAQNLFEGPTTIAFVAIYEGLAGRRLVSMTGRRAAYQDRTARQDAITLRTTVTADAIDANLPEIVRPLLAPLYALFDFAELSGQLVAEELARMRAGSF